GAEHGRQVVAGVSGLERQIGVVVIEIANEQAVDERGPLRTGAAAAEHAGPGLSLHAQGAALGNGVGVGVHGTDRRGERVDEAALGFVHDRSGQVLKAKLAGVFGKPVGQGLCHREVLRSSTKRVYSAGWRLRYGKRALSETGHLVVNNRPAHPGDDSLCFSRSTELPCEMRWGTAGRLDEACHDSISL